MDIICAKHTVKSSASFDFMKFEGTYLICAPDINDFAYDCREDFILHLAVSSTRSHIWGSFDFGAFEGKMRSRTSLATSDGNVEFHWSGRDTGEGESTFGEKNVIYLNFSGNGTVHGEMYWDCMGKFKLTGAKMIKEKGYNEALSKNIPKWKVAYRELDQWNWDRECVERWRGYYGGKRRRRTANSDTDGGLENESEEEVEVESGEEDW